MQLYVYNYIAYYYITYLNVIAGLFLRNCKSKIIIFPNLQSQQAIFEVQFWCAGNGPRFS